MATVDRSLPRLQPRPGFQRDGLPPTCIDGQWDFAFDDEDQGILADWSRSWPANKNKQIEVPFVFQTPASGINEQAAHPVVWYKTVLSPNPAIAQDRERQYKTVLRFGAVDYETTVWLGGVLLGTHRGGHVPFEFDITDEIDAQKPTSLVLRVWDSPTDLTQPRGKQYWAAKPEGIFYTPSTGIWQSVWLDYVPTRRIADSSYGTIIRSDDIKTGEVRADISIIQDKQEKRNGFVTIKASLAGTEIASSQATRVLLEKNLAKVSVNVRLSQEQQGELPQSFLDANPLSESSCWNNGVALWSPEHPILYDLEISLSEDRDGTKVIDTIHTYTGMRSISWSNGDGTLRLNEQPYFQALVLDQGYWPTTNMTPRTNECCKEDIMLAKAMGFNGCRKHQKVEAPEFLYWADRLGFLVWGEMANSYEFSREYVDRFDQEWREAVLRDINHPCIVAWTPINETWGYGDLANDPQQQSHLRSLYHQTKTLDPTRPINDNCGWEHVETDLTTFHDYADGAQLAKTCMNIDSILSHKAGRAMFVGSAAHKKGAPVLCTEFGGVNIALKQGEKGIDGEWGYTTASDPQDLLERVRELMIGVVEGGHCCGFVYTQLTDIEQETNGLYTYDRKAKLPAAAVKKIIEDVKRIYLDKLAIQSGKHS